MGHVLGFFDVRTFIKIAATVAVALLAFGAMANPAWAQDTTLSIDKTADPDPVVVGKELTYTMVVTNTGASEAENAMLLDTFDFGTVDVASGSFSASTTVGSCGRLNSTNLLCSFGNLAPGAKVTVTVRLQPTTQGMISNTARADATNASVVEDVVTTHVVPGLTTLTVEKTADPEMARAGKVLTYTVVVTNTGNSEAEEVSLLDSMDFGDTNVDPGSVSASTTQGSCTVENPTTVICPLGNLAPGASATVTVQVEPTTQGMISNTARADATNASEVGKAITTTVVPDLVIEKSASVPKVWIDTAFDYTLRVTNQGPTTADNVIVTDVLPVGPQGQWVVPTRLDGGDFFVCGEDQLKVVLCGGSLPAGETGLITLGVLVEPSTTAWVLNNTAEVSVQGISSVISTSNTVTTQAVPCCGSGLPGEEPGEEPGEDNGARVLVEHKGKELCLPKAALNGHLRHGDEVISEEGCSNAASSAKNGKKGRNK